jgi:hypothetical protein
MRKSDGDICGVRFLRNIAVSFLRCSAAMDNTATQVEHIDLLVNPTISKLRYKRTTSLGVDILISGWHQSRHHGDINLSQS